jgi:hypothetical protein
VAAGETWHSETAAVPGIYQWLVSAQPVHLSAVNFPESESRLKPLDEPPGSGDGSLAAKGGAARVALEDGMPLWPWLVAVALACLLLEGVISGLKLKLPVLIPLLLLALVLVNWLSWRGSAGLPMGKRITMLALRMAGAAALCVILLNPGKWVRPTEERERPWLVMLDRSASMAQPAEKGTRAEAAAAWAREAEKAAKQRGVPVKLHLYDSAAEAALQEAPEKIEASGAGSDLEGSLKRLAGEAAAAGDSFAGVLALTDGRQTAQPTEVEMESLALRLRSRKTPFHAIAIGAGLPMRDLVVRTTRPTVTVFKGQKARIPFSVAVEGMGPQKPEVRLLAEDGKELAKQAVETAPGKSGFGIFELEAPAASTRWTLEGNELREQPCACQRTPLGFEDAGLPRGGRAVLGQQVPGPAPAPADTDGGAFRPSPLGRALLPDRLRRGGADRNVQGGLSRDA